MENIELRQVEKVLDFINLLETENQVNFRNLLEFLKEFGGIYDKKKTYLPYHINLIDELHADENAHSRIFAKLLRYKEKDKYPFLEKFLNDVCNFNLSIEKPKVKKVDSCGRIDIPIFDKKYVVVIENKVTDKAPDQNGEKGGQLARYIETIRDNYRRELQDIFVVYTPKYTREPSDDCWKNKNEFSHKINFKLRFRSLSYRDVVYPWFKNEILPVINKKDIYLRSAVEQYIDHLEGMFSLRKIDKKMNMELQKFIKQKFELNDENPEEAIEILSAKEREINNAISQINQLKSQYKKMLVINYFEKWEKQLKKDFSNFKIVSDKFKLNKKVINIGIIFTIDNKNYAAIIECNDYNKLNIYFGIGHHFISDKKDIVHESLREVLSDKELIRPKEFWYGRKYTSLENGYYRLENLIKEIIDITKN